jgi:hypothetical protein
LDAPVIGASHPTRLAYADDDLLSCLDFFAARFSLRLWLGFFFSSFLGLRSLVMAFAPGQCPSVGEIGVDHPVGREAVL